MKQQCNGHPGRAAAIPHQSQHTHCIHTPYTHSTALQLSSALSLLLQPLKTCQSQMRHQCLHSTKGSKHESTGDCSTLWHTLQTQVCTNNDGEGCFLDLTQEARWLPSVACMCSLAHVRLVRHLLYVSDGACSMSVLSMCLALTHLLCTTTKPSVPWHGRHVYEQ